MGPSLGTGDRSWAEQRPRGRIMDLNIIKNSLHPLKTLLFSRFTYGRSTKIILRKDKEIIIDCLSFYYAGDRAKV